MYWRINATQVKTIRDYAKKAAGKKRVTLEVGIRYRTEPPHLPVNENIMLLTDDPDFGPTDLHDKGDLHAGQHIELTPAGRALIDIYVYEGRAGEYGDLETNVQAHVGLLKGKPTVWKLTGTMYPALIVNQTLADAFATEPVGIDG